MKFVDIACLFLAVVPALSAPHISWSIWGHHESDNPPSPENPVPQLPADKEPHYNDFPPPAPANEEQRIEPPPPKPSMSHMSHEPSATVTETETTSTSKVPWYTLPVQPALNPNLNLVGLGPTINPHQSTGSSSTTSTSSTTEPSATSTGPAVHRRRNEPTSPRDAEVIPLPSSKCGWHCAVI